MGRFGEEAAVEVRFELEETVVDTEAVIFEAAGEQDEVLLLAGEALEDLKQLVGGAVERVVKLGFEFLAALLPTEGLFTQISDFAMDVEVQALKMVEFAGVSEHLNAKRRADGERRTAWVFVELADFVGGGVGVFANGDFDEFRSAGRKNAAKGQLSSLSRSHGEMHSAGEQKQKQDGSEFAPEIHGSSEMREGVEGVAEAAAARAEGFAG